MENEVKQRNQRNRRRERAQRMQAQRESKAKDGDSAEDESPAREKPQRPPNRRKKSKEPPFEEDIIDGFAILAFRTYEDLESVMKHAGKNNIKNINSLTLGCDEKPKVDTGQKIVNSNHHITPNPTPCLVSLNHDAAGTSDDSGRASERLNGPIAPRDRDSSHDRLSDASSHCSSGKGYICDSEGEDDKGSDAGSDLFTTTRKHELPGNPPPPSINNGTGSPGGGSGSGSPAPSPPPPAPPPPPRISTPPTSNPPPPNPPPSPSQPSVVSNGPIPRPVAPSPPPAQPPPLVPLPLPLSIPQQPPPPPTTTASAPPVTVPVPPPQHCPNTSNTKSNSRTSSPATAAPAQPAPNSYAPLPLAAYPPNPHPHPHPAYPPLYAPYSTTLQHSPYLPQAAVSPLPSPRNDTRSSRSPCPIIAKQPQLSGGSAAIPSATTPVTAASAPIATTTTAPAVTTATAVVITTTTTSHRDIVTTPVVGRSHSPRGHSPNRERDSYSSNVSSLSRSSITPVSAATLSSSCVITCNSSPFSSAPAPAPAVVSSSLAFTKTPAWGSSSGPQLSPAASVPRPTPPPVPLPAAHSLHPSSHPFPPPMFAPPLPPPAATASPLSLPPSANPNPFSAESLFQSNQADLLRRELDSRFLASQDRSLNVGPPPYLRTEMHHHQHQHTHVHQHTAPILPPPPAPALFPPPLFKDIPKLGGVDSPFYRQNMGLTSYPGFSPGLLHPSLGGSTPFAPPNHLPTFTPKVVDSRARNLADGSVQQRQRKQLEVFQAQVPGGSLQVIRTQSVTSTSSSRTIHGNISSDFENLQLNLNPLDLSTQKTKASVGRSGSISSRRPPSRPRSLINKPTGEISEENSFLAAENRLSEVSRLCRQFHDEAKQNISKGVTPSIVSIGSDEKYLKDDDVISNGHNHSVLIRKKSCSTEDLQNSEHDGEEKSSEYAGMMADWKRDSKFRRSLQFPSKGGQLDLIPNGNVSKICKEIEESKKENAMKNTTSNFESLESILRSGSIMKNKLINENITTDKSENEPEVFARRINPIKTAPQKRHSFVTVESLKEVRGRLRRLSSPPLDGIKHNTTVKATDDSDDGIETENNSQVKTYMYGMSALNNGIRNNFRKPVPGTGSLESRASNRSSSSSGSRSEEWYNRRKSYGFEQVHGHQNGNQPQSMSFQDKNRVESSTDSGICRSSETVTASSWSQLFGRPKDDAEDSSIKVSHSIQIKKFGNERDGSDSDSRGTQKGRRTVVTLGSEGNAKGTDSSLKDSVAKPLNSWKNELSHISSFATDKSVRRLSEPVTVSIPIIADDGANINGNVDSKRIYFRQLTEGTNLGVESTRRKSGSFLENGSSEKNLSDETKSLAARRELLMKHRAAQETGMPFRPWSGNGRAYLSRQGDSEIKRHSIAVDETKYVTKNLQKDDYFSYDSGFSASTKSIPDFENGDCKISVDFRSADAVEDEDDESFLQQLAGKKQKKVEFCKTEVHFAAEPGRFNIVETDEKPPPTNMFRRRRRNSISNLSTAQAQEANKSSLPEIRFGDSLYEKKLLGGTDSNPPGALSLDSSLNASFGLKRAEPVVAPGFQDVADKDDIIYTQANATILASVRQEVSEAAIFNDLEEISGDSMQAGSPVNSRPRSILKNNRRPRPFHLGETEEESFSSTLGSKFLEPETRWGVRLKPVQTKEPAMWRSTVSLQNSTYENQQQSFNQTEEKFPKHITPLQNSSDETELQKLLKSLRPASQRKSTSDVFLSPEPKENGVEIKISTPSSIQPASWSVAERVRQVEDWKLGSVEARGYSTRVNFGAGEATVVESDGQQRHATPSVTLYQPNNQRKPMWLRREERKMETADVKKQTVSDKGLIVHIGKNEDSDAKDEAFQRREDAGPTKTTTIMIDLSPSPSDNKLFQRDFEKKSENSKSKKLTTATGHTGSLRSPSLIMKTISKSSLVQDVGTEDDVVFVDRSQRSLNSNSEDSNQTSIHNESETDSSSEANHAVKSTGKESKARKEDYDIIVVPNQLAALKELYYNAELSDDSERADEEVRSYMSGGGDEDDRERDEDVSSVVSGSWSRMRAFRNIQQHFNKIAQSQTGKTEVSSPAKLKDATFQRSVATAQVESYNDSNRLRTVETLVSTRCGHPKITSISLRYEGDENENNKTRHSEYAVTNQDNFSGLQAANKNYLHISEPIASSSDLKQRVINKETFRIQKNKEKSPERKLSAADERNYENINPRTPERKSSSFSLDQRAVTSLKRRSCPEYENTVSLFSKDNPQKISMDFAVKNDLKTSVKETKRQSSSSLSSRQQQQQRKISLSSLDSPSDHSPTRKETNVEVRRRLYHPKSEESRRQSLTDAKSTKQDAFSHTSKEKNATVNVTHKLIRDRSRSPSKSVPQQSKPKESKNKEDTESHIYENIIPSSKASRVDGVETESVILEELTRAADQILQAVNGYTDEESYKASSDDDEHDDSFRGGRRRGKRYQVRKVSGNLGTISESPSLKKQIETENGTESHKNDSNKRNPRLPKTRLCPTSSTSSIESFTKEVTRSSLNHSQEQRKSKASTANGAVKSSARSARLLQRASSRELLLQTYGSSSEDGGSIRKPAVPRRSRHSSVITKTDSVTTNAKKTLAESQQSPVAKARQRKRDAATTKPKERLSGSTNKTAPLARKTSAGDSASKSRSSRSRDEEKLWRGSSHPSSRRETSDLRHRAQGGGTAAAGEATGHDKTERAERRAGGATKSAASSSVVTKKKPALASSHNGSLQAK